MFYQPGSTSHGLARDPFKACVVPRPIGWISTRSSTGQDNLAPYSQFNNLTFDPPYVMFAANQTETGVRKDTTVNVETTGEFVWNMATYPLREAVNITAEQMSPGIDEFERANLRKEQATLVNVAMVLDSPVKFECKYHSTLRLPGNPPMGSVDIIIGLVVGVHVSDNVLTDGMIDVTKTEPIARCGYYQYARIRETFDMVIPGGGKVLYGLEGSTRLNAKERRVDPDGQAGGVS
ncbi:typically associated with flavo protein oxygenase [Mollisia scopiformis]|uniref:Typically associated with flavo protein oxygenase n=1 Tax=Mollisia scopiformis TaxID=149040 RepID=A0A194XL52_MOLSC|nr:typically associated with flavo protein oxygenase [Mollisia scopiformis]KUJ20861.1 typically associated with flavo protein oxygenase [Mollisia scopiformis]